MTANCALFQPSFSFNPPDKKSDTAAWLQLTQQFEYSLARIKKLFRPDFKKTLVLVKPRLNIIEH